MKLSDLITGIVFILGGSIGYWAVYKDPSKKSASYLALAMIFVGTMIAFGKWIMDMVFAGK